MVLLLCGTTILTGWKKDGDDDVDGAAEHRREKYCAKARKYSGQNNQFNLLAGSFHSPYSPGFMCTGVWDPVYH